LIHLGPDWEILPNLADSWDISEDGLTFTFHINPDAVFHDGEPLTSEDVVFTFSEDVVSLNPTYGSWGAQVESVTAPDDVTVVIQLSSALPYFLPFAGYYVPILPKHLYEGTDISTNPYNEAPIGSGPFKFVEWVKGDHITAEKNENFFREDSEGRQLPFIDELVIPIIPDSAMRTSALEAGEVDYLSGFATTPSDWQRFDADPDYTVTFKEYHGTAIQYIFFNLRREPFDSKEIRRAVCYGVDKQPYLDNVFYGAGAVVQSNMPSAYSWWVNPDAKQPEYDTTMAIDMLADLGYNESNPLSFDCVFDVGRSDQVKVAEIFQSQMAEIGVQVELEGLEAGVIPSILGEDFNFDTHVISITKSVDPVIGQRRVLHSENIVQGYIRNLAGYNNSEMDEALEGATVEPDPDDREPYFYKVQELFAEDVPMISLYEKYNPSYYRNDRIGGGLGDYPGGSRLGYNGGNDFSYVWLHMEAEEDMLWGMPIMTAYAIIAGVVIAIVIIAGAAIYLRRK
jgi:peptide/nickel transport system substrate-binding protein